MTPAFAQNAQIGGRVPATTITLTNTQTGVLRNSSSNEEGDFAIPALQPGQYKLTAQKEGFKPLNHGCIVVQIGDRITLNLALEPGTSTESVTITSEVPLLRTEDAQQPAYATGTL